MLQLMPQTRRGLSCLRPIIRGPRIVRSIVARPSTTQSSLLRRQIRRYSSESSHSGNDTDTKASVLWSNALIWSTLAVWTYSLTVLATTSNMQSTEPVSIKTAQTSVADEYDQPSTPQHTQQELERQKRLNEYRWPLFRDVQERCKHICTQSSVPYPLIQEVHAIYVREIGTNIVPLMNSESGQNETRTTREELQRLARLNKERHSMFRDLERRCEDLCSDSPKPCSIWQEVHRIHEREMDTQENEGGESGWLRGNLQLDRQLAEERQNQRS